MCFDNIYKCVLLAVLTSNAKHRYTELVRICHIMQGALYVVNVVEVLQTHTITQFHAILIYTSKKLMMKKQEKTTLDMIVNILEYMGEDISMYSCIHNTVINTIENCCLLQKLRLHGQNQNNIQNEILKSKLHEKEKDKISHTITTNTNIVYVV